MFISVLFPLFQETDGKRYCCDLYQHTITLIKKIFTLKREPKGANSVLIRSLQSLVSWAVSAAVVPMLTEAG